METQIRCPYIVRMTDFGIDARFDCGSVDGADNSKMFADLFGYDVLYKGYVFSDNDFKLVQRGVRYANESQRNGVFNPDVLKDVLPNLI